MNVNLKRSGVSAASRKTERALLQRTLDSVWDLIELLVKKVNMQNDAQRIESLVIDFADAFGQIPLGDLEWKFTVSSTTATTTSSSGPLRGPAGRPSCGQGQWRWHAA